MRARASRSRFMLEVYHKSEEVDLNHRPALYKNAALT